MSQRAILLIVDTARWEAACLHRDGRCERKTFEEEGPDAIAAIKVCLDEWSPGEREVCLGLPSQWFLSAAIDVSDLPRRGRAAAMLYRLEEQLPLDVEQLAASFIPSSAGKALGVAVETARVKEVIDGLAASGIDVVSVCPTALLSWWAFGQKGGAAADFTLICGSRRVDVFRQIEGHLVGWSTAPRDSTAVAEVVRADDLLRPSSEEPTAVALGAPPDGLEEALRDRAGVSLLATDEVDPKDLAIAGASKVLIGARPDWLDFRRDALGMPDAWGRVSGLVIAAAVLCTLCLVAAGAFFYWRAYRYESMIRLSEKAQEDVYRELHPYAVAPPSVTSRLRSELTRLSGTSGSQADLPERPSALESLRRAAAGLPPNARLRIVEMRLDPSGVYIEGQVRSHGDAEVIGGTLRKQGFDMAPPRTAQIEGGGVSFTLMGKVEAAKEGKP